MVPNQIVIWPKNPNKPNLKFQTLKGTKAINATRKQGNAPSQAQKTQILGEVNVLPIRTIPGLLKRKWNNYKTTDQIIRILPDVIGKLAESVADYRS